MVGESDVAISRADWSDYMVYLRLVAGEDQSTGKDLCIDNDYMIASPASVREINWLISARRPCILGYFGNNNAQSHFP